MTSLNARRFGSTCAAALLGALILGTATPAIAGDPASFTSYQVVNYSADNFLVSGTIQDEAPTQCLIVFSGLLWGHFATPDESGYFELDFILSPGRSGLATALLYDPEWLFTDVAQAYIE